MKEDRLSSGSVLGGMLLIAGSCIGAGMLALPILTGLSGFFPSLIMLVVSWAFMTFTALLLVEATGWFFSQVNLISMAKESLGEAGKWISWISYLFLFYSLLVAYVAASGSVFAAILESLFSLAVPPYLASIFFTVFFGYLVYLGTRPVDLLNRVLMAGLIITYFAMVGLGISKIEPVLLLRFAPQYMLSSLPILVVSFGFQNMIPSITAYMKGDLKRVRLTILGGSLIALGVYVIWSALILGIVPYEGTQGIVESYRNGEEATKALNAALGSSSIRLFSQGFAFFAIVTSFIAQGLTLTHFLADGFKISPIEKKGRLLTLLALAPPLIFALYNPQVFFKALSLAGGLFAMILFGILPIAMAWIGRYRKNLTSNYHVYGGKLSLILGLIFAILVIGCEFWILFKNF